MISTTNPDTIARREAMKLKYNDDYYKNEDLVVCPSEINKTYYESYNNKFSQSDNFSEFVSSKKSIYSQSSKYHGESLSCENTRLLSKQLKSQKTNETHGLIQWTCKKCDGCIKYKQMAREHKIEDKFIDNPDIDVNDLWIITINSCYKPPQETKRMKYQITKNNLGIDLLLYAVNTNDLICYLISGNPEELEFLNDVTENKITLDKAIDFFGPLATKFLGPFYGNKRLPELSGTGDKHISKCVCGRPEEDHQFVLTNEDEIRYTMIAIPEYEYGFKKFKKMLLPPGETQTKLAEEFS